MEAVTMSIEECLEDITLFARDLYKSMKLDPDIILDKFRVDNFRVNCGIISTDNFGLSIEKIVRSVFMHAFKCFDKVAEQKIMTFLSNRAGPLIACSLYEACMYAADRLIVTKMNGGRDSITLRVQTDNGVELIRQNCYHKAI